MFFNSTGILMLIALLSVVFMLASLIREKKKTLIMGEFIILFLLLIIHSIGLILQIIYSKTSIPPIYFDYITYISAVFIPVIFTYIALTYSNKNINIKRYLWLIIIPIISLLVLWTNDWHHLFYEYYSINLEKCVQGSYSYVHILYSYILLLYAFIVLIRGTIKKSGFLSWQTTLIILGAMAPIIPNVLGSFKLIPMTIYITPMMFTISAICFYISIIKLKALNVIPVTIRTIIDSMSDAFVVISEDGTIVDLNQTFTKMFKQIYEVKDKDNFFDLIEKTKIIDLAMVKEDINKTLEKKEAITKEYHIELGEFNKYLEVDCQPIKAKHGNEYVAFLILIRDITEQKRNIEIITKNENLVILGELAGGVAHDVNTPISAIKTGILMLKDTVASDNERALLKSMDSCADKIIKLVNSLRNQIRNIGSDNIEEINISSLISDAQIILHNELTKNNVNMIVDIKDDVKVKGNSTKLSQVITNLIINAIQAYSGKGGSIEVELYRNEDTDVVISIADHASGIPESIKPYIFKNILTTKGVAGTGFGLYLAYSVIKGAFGGEITFDTKEGEGTIFNIVLPTSIVV